MSNPISNLQAQVQDIIFDKGSTFTKDYYRVLKSTGGVYSAHDLSAYAVTLTAKTTHSSVLPLWAFSSSDPSPVVSVITISGTELASITGLPLSNLPTIWGVRVVIPDTVTALIDWKPQVRLPLTGFAYDSAVYDIELSATGLPTFKLVKGRFYAAEEVTK